VTLPVSHPQDWRTAWLVLAAGLVARLVVAAQFPLLADETYYWMWSRQLATGYFDHPPIIAWIIALGTTLVGDTPVGVRFVPIILGSITGAVLIDAARSLAGPRAALQAALLITLLPLAGAGYVLATPDAPLLAGIALTWWALVHALHPTTTGTRRLAWWSAAGVAIGVAMASKFTGVLVPASLAIACILLPRHRRILATPGPYLSVLVASIVMLPVLWWNAQHDWVTFRFQLEHGLGTPPDASLGATLGRVGELIGGQLGLTGVIIGVLFFVAAWRAIRARVDGPTQLLAASAALCVLFFVYSALRKPVEANWPAIAYPALVLVLATASTHGFAPRTVRAGHLLSGLLTGVVYLYALGVIPPANVRPGRDPFNRAFGWDGLAAAVDAAARGTPGTVHLAANRYQDASELAFHSPGQPFVMALNVAARPNQFDLWAGMSTRARRGDALIVALDTLPRPHRVVDSLAVHFGAVQDLGVVPLLRGSRTVAWRRLWRFTDWRGTWFPRHLPPT
jgi:4-amino-4-deoxy-L-arabinose transferase-like glycosyltransferase